MASADNPLLAKYASCHGSLISGKNFFGYGFKRYPSGQDRGLVKARTGLPYSTCKILPILEFYLIVRVLVVVVHDLLWQIILMLQISLCCEIRKDVAKGLH